MKRKLDQITNPPDESKGEIEEDKPQYKYFIQIDNFHKERSKPKIRKKLEPLAKKLIGYKGKFKKSNQRRAPKSIQLFFNSDEDANKSLEIIKEHNSDWDAFSGREVIRNIRKRRKIDFNGDKRTVEDAVTPLHKMDYSQQLEKKKNGVLRYAQKTYHKIRKSYSNYDEIPSHIKKVMAAKKSQKNKIQFIGEYLGIKESPLIDGYRNHVEFTCGVNKEGENEVGFLLGRMSESIIAVGSPYGCRNVPALFKLIGKRMKSIINKSGLQVYHKYDHTGVFRQIKVKENYEHDVLLQIQICKKNIANDENYSKVCKLLKQMFIHEDHWKKEIKIKFKIIGITLQLYDGLSNKATHNDSTNILLYGIDFIIEKVLNFSFKISSESFFQVNTKGAELLYTIVRNWMSPLKKKNQKTLLFDICCGTGTIGQLLSEFVDAVVGIDILQSCIDDANENAKLNDVTNVEYIVGKVENVIKNVIRLKEKEYNRFIAIVDPPRSGLMASVLVALRSSKKIEDIIYVSCNPATLFDNCIHLCKKQSNKFKEKPFIPIKFVTVDMFPHCNHCENVMFLHRDLKKKREKKIKVSPIKEIEEEEEEEEEEKKSSTSIIEKEKKPKKVKNLEEK